MPKTNRQEPGVQQTQAFLASHLGTGSTAYTFVNKEIKLMAYYLHIGLDHRVYTGNGVNLVGTGVTGT